MSFEQLGIALPCSLPKPGQYVDSAPLLLAVVATLGYLFGRRRPTIGHQHRADGRNEVMRALAVARELEAVAERLQSGRWRPTFRRS